MRALALLCLGVLLLSSPARADFFGDLGAALNKLGKSVEEAFTSEPKESADDSAVPAPQPPLVIHWNPPPPDLVLPVKLPPLPRPKPSADRTPQFAVIEAPPAPTYAYQVRSSKDDAPQPKAQPVRPVQTVAMLTPPPGFQLAPALTPRPMAAPAPDQLNRAAPQAGLKTSAQAQPPSTPVAIASGYRLRFGLQSAMIPDTGAGSSPSVIKAAARAVTTQKDMRLRLIAETTQPQGARSLSLKRALQVKQWLEAEGVRPTQIDLDVRGQGSAELVNLTPYQAR